MRKKEGIIVKNLRNVAIIAHVDHGKTTLVDSLLRQSGIFRANEEVAERVMDSGDIEKERGITILSKNTSVMYEDVKINIEDTPGHADFGGEVERVLKMVDGVLLVVDAFDGPMPQTRFVLSKALSLNLTPIVVINKVDRPGARPAEVLDEVLELFMDLNANDEQLNFQTVYASGKSGFARYNVEDTNEDMIPLFKTIIEYVPEPAGDENGTMQVLISNIEHDEYTGRIGIGRVERGNIKNGQNVAICKKDGTIQNIKIGKLYTYVGLKRVETEVANCGDIIAITGLEGINIGETVADPLNPEKIPFVDIDEPTVSMMYNKEHGITPQTIKKSVRDAIEATVVADEEAIYGAIDTNDIESIKESIITLQEEMMEAAQNLQFERAAQLRDKIKELEDKLN